MSPVGYPNILIKLLQKPSAERRQRFDALPSSPKPLPLYPALPSPYLPLPTSAPARLDIEHAYSPKRDPDPSLRRRRSRKRRPRARLIY